jgi:hypothetical protein
VAPIEGVERRRRLSGVLSHGEEVAEGTQRCATWWHRPKEAAVRRPEEGETLGRLSWAGVGRELGRL